LFGFESGLKLLADHPNANLPSGKAGPAEAVFEVAIDGVKQDLPWVDGKTSPPELSSIGIFDSRCARAYLDSEDDFSYVPYGLDVFEGLAKGSPRSDRAPDTHA
jgi:hypothetical protein